MKHMMEEKEMGMDKMSKNERMKKMAREVMHNEPSTVSRANVSGKKKRKMKIAIALSKARKMGARIPKKA